MAISRRKLILGGGALGIAVVGGAVLTPIVRRPGILEESTSRALPVETDINLPLQADVVIIGGGIQGVCSALSLVERGFDVVICDKGEVAGEQSGRAYSQIICWELEKNILPLILHSKQLWRGMNERLGVDTSHRIQPRVQTYTNDKALNAARAWAKMAHESVPKPELLDIRFIEGAELQSRLPGARTKWSVGGFELDAGSVDPEIGTPMIARYLKTKGVKIFTHCAVRGLETSGGRVSGVVTEKGSIRTSNVVLAGGAWSRLFLGNYDLELRTLPIYLSQQRLTGVEGAPKGNGAIGDGIYWRLQADGTYANAPRIYTAPILKESFTIGMDFLPHVLAGGMEGLPIYYNLNSDFIRSFKTPTHWSLDQKTPFEEMRIAAPTPNIEFLDLGLRRLRDEFPVFEDSKVIERWAARTDFVADFAPVISPVDKIPGLIINTGHTWGMTQGPAAGEMVADMITGVEPRVDPKPYAFSRFKA